jgi:hypothetical protein
VFITGGLENKGRVSSHPRREAGASKKQKQQADEEERLELMPTEPLVPAWDDLMSVSNHGVVYLVQIAALHTILEDVLRGKESDSAVKFALAFPKYLPPDIQPSSIDEDFRVNTQCLVHLSPEPSEEDLTDSYCIFLYEVRWNPAGERKIGVHR